MNKQVNQVSIKADKAIPEVIEQQLTMLPLSCQIEPASLTCLVGPHRAQLRAYLQMLAGITKLTEGELSLFGRKVSVIEPFDPIDWQKNRCQVGYLSGAAPLLSVQHGLMNVMLPVLYHENSSFREASDKARNLLAELNCDFEPTTYPALLNNFQRLQLSLARALILDPLALFLDVPFNDLGMKDRKNMGVLLAKYINNHTSCMIGGLQYPRFLEQHAKQIIFISEHNILKFDGWTSFKQSNDSEIHDLLSIL